MWNQVISDAFIYCKQTNAKNMLFLLAILFDLSKKSSWLLISVKTLQVENKRWGICFLFSDFSKRWTWTKWAGNLIMSCRHPNSTKTGNISRSSQAHRVQGDQHSFTERLAAIGCKSKIMLDLGLSVICFPLPPWPVLDSSTFLCF